MPKNQLKRRHVVDLIVVVENSCLFLAHGFYGCMHGFYWIVFIKKERFEISNRSFNIYSKTLTH